MYRGYSDLHEDQDASTSSLTSPAEMTPAEAGHGDGHGHGDVRF